MLDLQNQTNGKVYTGKFSRDTRTVAVQEIGSNESVDYDADEAICFSIPQAVGGDGLLFVTNPTQEGIGYLLKVADEVIVYCWGRDYPSDVRLYDGNGMPESLWEKIGDEWSFAGSSHDEITATKYRAIK